MKKFFLCCLCVPLVLAASAAAEPVDDFVIIAPEDMVWQSPPEMAGIEGVLLYGNPGEPGLYIMRARFAPGHMSPPHTHDQDRMVTVISGTWAFGRDASGTCENTVALEAGAFAVHPQGAIHYDGSCSDTPTVVEIRGMGPVSTTLVSVD